MMDKCSLVLLKQSSLNIMPQAVSFQNVRYYHLSLPIIITNNEKQERDFPVIGKMESIRLSHLDVRANIT